MSSCFVRLCYRFGPFVSSGQPDATRLSLASEAQYIRSEIGYLVPT